MFKEQKIATYTEPGKRIQLLKQTELDSEGFETCNEKYQIRINRKIEGRYWSEIVAKKAFAARLTIEILQQKFTF